MGATAPADQANTQQVKQSTFNIFVREVGTKAWNMLPSPYVGISQDIAKRDAARALVNHDVYGKIITEKGLELAAVSVRSFQPVTVKVEPQPAKVTIR